MLSVAITIKGDKETIAALGKLGSSFLNFQMAMRSIGKELTNYYGNNVFNSQGGAIGQRWPALAQATKKQKVKKFYTATPLVNTGDMKKGFTSTFPDVNSVTIGNKMDYFKYHQSSAPRTRLPRRVMMSTGGSVKTIIGDIIQADIEGKIEKAGL